jgi:cell wall-associated NlpC family hydrolase
VTRRLAVLLALLASLLVVPATASADRPSGGATATVVSSIPVDDDTGGADADQIPDDVPDASAEDGGDAGVDDDGSSDEWWADDDGTDGAATPGAPPTPTPPAPDPAVLVPVPSSQRTIKGRVARLRTDGRAAIPRSAPKRVKRVLAAANLIVGKPYKWGGGHSRLIDSGYDCSGAVGYALIRAGLLDTTMVSGTFARWGRAGAGRWISIHANRGHVYLEIAGLRLDTSAVGDAVGGKGVRWRPVIGRRAGFHTRHIQGL